jgi:hypothetical protein
MSYVAHLSLQTKPGSFQKVCDRYHQFAQEVLAGHPDLHDVIIVGNQALNIVQGFGIWDNADQAASLEDTESFSKFLADIEANLAAPIGRNDLLVFYRMNPKS